MDTFHHLNSSKFRQVLPRMYIFTHVECFLLFFINRLAAPKLHGTVITEQAWTITSLSFAITGSTVVLTCCKGDGQSQWKTPILAPHSSETPKPISIKFETDDYVVDATPHAKFGFCMFSGDTSPYRWNCPPVSIFYLFFFFLLFDVLAHLHRSHRSS